MAAPAIVWIRDNVGFVIEAAKSFARLERELGRRADVNRTYADYNTQLRMYNNWNRYVNSGYNPAYYPGHSRALHPDYSMHCKGLAWDSDDWATPGFNALAARHGWIRTAANDPTERHHFEYQWWMDQHRFEPAPGFDNVTPIPTVPTEEEELMGAKEDIIKNQNAVLDTLLKALRREERYRRVSTQDRRFTILGRPGHVIRLSDNAGEADEQMRQIAARNSLIMHADELGGSLPLLELTAFYTLIDQWDPNGDHGFGTFVGNTFDVTGGSTHMHRQAPNVIVPYPDRQAVWANLKPVALYYNGVRIIGLKKPNIAILEDNSQVALTEVEVERANAQRPGKQVWS